MLPLGILSFSLLFVSHALSLPSTLAVRGTGNTTYPTNTSISSSAVGPVAVLTVANKVIAPDGFSRSATLVNGIFPGPLIQANKGDEFSLQVKNELTDPSMNLDTTIHWHGIFEKKANWADGTSYVTQCPLVQNDTFEYKPKIGTQTGTYWYHSHYSNQYCDGLRGALVIYDPEDPLAYLYDVDDESTVITLSDWYHSSSIILGAEFQPINPNSTLINGQGRYAGGPDTPFAVVNVKQGLRYRFRVVAISCNPQFNFTIDGHRMTIIEVEGNEVEPVEVDSLSILAGQRYSVVITANQPVGNYWIRASTDISETFEGGQNLAVFRYEGAADQDPTSAPGPYELSFDEGNLHPLVDPAAPGIPEIGKADVNIQLSPGFNTEGYYTINNVAYVNPPVPVLLQILSGARHPSQLLPNGSVHELPPNKVIEISFGNPTIAPGGPHPIHLHGHAFSVVRLAGTNATNFVNPVRRDVVSLGNSTTDNVTIRFVTDNPGPWFLHCHIDWHLTHGFAVVMAEAPGLAAQQEAKVAPEQWYQLCQASNATLD